MCSIILFWLHFCKKQLIPISKHYLYYIPQSRQKFPTTKHAKMVRRCAVPDCTSTDSNSLCHRFPCKTHLAAVWQQSLDLTHIPVSELYLRFVVCTIHFTATDYRNELSKNLNVTAVPRLFRPLCAIALCDAADVADDDDDDDNQLNSAPTISPHDLNFTEYDELPPASSTTNDEDQMLDELYEEHLSTSHNDAIASSEYESTANTDAKVENNLSDPEPFQPDDNTMNYDTGDLSFPDPCKDLPDFATSDFLLEAPTILEDQMPSLPDTTNHLDTVADDQFVYVMQVTPPPTEHPPIDFMAATSDIDGVDLAAAQVRVSIEDGQLVFQTGSDGSSFGDFQLVGSSASPSFAFQIDQQQLSERQDVPNNHEPVLLVHEQYVAPAGGASCPPAMYKDDDDDDVFTDEMRLYNEMSKKSLVQLMVKANKKIHELEERLETIESAHAKVLGSLELFRSVLRP